VQNPVQPNGILVIAPPDVTDVTDVTDTVLAGASLAAFAIPVVKPPMTIATTAINAAFRTSRLIRIVPPG
jgi:hypothetical protein